MVSMTKRILVTIAASATLALLAPGAASARIIELGATTNPTAPSCPSSPCLAVTRTSGFQFTTGGRRNPFKVSRTGRIVAFTLTLGSPTKKQIQFFDQQSGGSARARIAVLKPVKSKKPGQVLYQLNAQTNDFPLEKFFGKTVQFPLYTSLLVKKGYQVALTVPTWAPVLSVSGLDNGFSWRSSRVKPCSTNPERQPPQTAPGSTRQYFCTYRPARLTYSATMVTSP